MGLPGAGKTTLAANITSALSYRVGVTWLNADAIRETYQDWDFSNDGRLRQAHRMRNLADKEISKGNICVCDFVAPTKEIRDIFDADYTIWLDTITEGRFEDTNKIFVPPEKYDIRIPEQDAKKWADIVVSQILVQNH